MVGGAAPDRKSIRANLPARRHEHWRPSVGVDGISELLQKLHEHSEAFYRDLHNEVLEGNSEVVTDWAVMRKDSGYIPPEHRRTGGVEAKLAASMWMQ